MKVNALKLTASLLALASLIPVLVPANSFSQTRLPGGVRIPNPPIAVPAPPRNRPARPEAAPAPNQTPTDRANRMRDRSGVVAPPARNAEQTMPDQDQGILNEMHRANIGRVVFTRTDLTVGSITPQSLIDTVTFGQPVFFRVYMDKTAVNTMLAQPGINPDRAAVASRIRYKARFTVNGQVIDTTFNFFGEISERNTYTTWRGQFLSRAPGNEASGLPGWEVFREFVGKGSQRGILRQGQSHRVTVEIMPTYAPATGGDGEPAGGPLTGPVVATGAFTLQIPAGAFNRNDAYVCVPAGPSDAAIERTAFGQMQRNWRNTDATPVAARIGLSGWEVNRNDLGIPIDREVDVVSVARGADGCYSTRYQWSEPWAGNGFSTQSGALSLYSPVRVYFPCSCIN